MAAPVLSGRGCICGLCVLLLMLAGVSQSGPITSPEDQRRAPVGSGGVMDGPILGQDNDLAAQELLSQFLSTLNLSARAAPSRPTHKEPPEYMLELYNRFANDRSAVPSANIVRSFKNEDASSYSVAARGVRIHPLLFNVSVPRHEHITIAELRLHTTLQIADRRQHAGLDREVTIYKIHESVHWRQEEEEGAEGRGADKEKEVAEMEDLEKLVTTRVRAKDDSWMSFDLTRVINLWQASGCTAHRLEVHVADSEPEEEGNPLGDAEDGRLVVVDIDRNLQGRNNPVVIVFSDDQSGGRERDDQSGGRERDEQELNQMLERESDLPRDLGQDQRAFWGHVDQNGDHAELDRQSLVQLQSNLIYDTPPRIRRHVKNEPCKRTPLFVDFKDIGWDAWVIRPLGYEAYECNGVCSPPMTPEVSPTKHAIVQTLLSVKSPKRASRACCVPTKLEPISLLYQENGVVVFNHKYDGMVVAECGCR